jgi:hypothetical protein
MTEVAVVFKACEMMLQMQSNLISALAQIILVEEAEAAEEIAAAPAGPPKAKGKSAK